MPILACLWEIQNSSVVEKALQTSIATQWVGLGVDGSPVFSKMCSVVFLFKRN